MDSSDIFYYPDVMVTCHPQNENFLELKLVGLTLTMADIYDEVL